MLRVLRLIVFIGLTAATAEAQGTLSEIFAILRTEGPTVSASGQARVRQILEPYATGKKDLDGEWPSINDALSDSSPFVRDQAGAALATIVYLSSTGVYANPPRLIRLSDSTRDVVIQRFGESKSNLRGNAIRIITMMAGGVPPGLAPQLIQIAKTDIDGEVRGVAIGALASIPSPAPEITEFWIQSLNNLPNKELRGKILSSFRAYAPADPRVIALVIDALKDTDYFVRQEAIAAVIKIGKPAEAAIPLLNEIHNSNTGADEMTQAMRMNAESAIRILSRP
jgi:HEAT repeat protein